MTAIDLGTVAWPPPVANQRQSDHRHRAPQTSRSLTSHTPAITSGQSQVLLLFPLRVFLAVGWLRAGIEKLINGQWWNGNALRRFVDVQRPIALPPFRFLMDEAIRPLAVVVAFVVMATEIACGIAIGVGRPLRLALRWAVLLNVVFMMAGPVNPSAFYLVMEFVLLLALAEGTIGASPSSPTHRTHILAAVLAAGAGALVPYVRTLEPAKVIADPALMLLFLAVLESATLSLRCLLARSSARAQKPVSRWTQRIVSWTRAMHETRQQPNRAAGPGTKVPQLITAVGWRRRS